MVTCQDYCIYTIALSKKCCVNDAEAGAFIHLQPAVASRPTSTFLLTYLLT